MNRPVVLYPALVLAFLLVRAGLFAVTTGDDYHVHREYGTAARSAPVADLYRDRDVEYPLLAVLFAAAPARLADHLPGWAPVLICLRPNKSQFPYVDQSPAEREAGDRYEVALGLVLFAVDAASLAVVWLIARRVYPHEGPLARVGRLAGYVVATSSVGLILYDRLDPVVGLCALLAVWALAEGRPRVGYAVLAAGAAYKLVPALLLPVWVFAAAAARPGHIGFRAVKEAIIAGVFLAAWPVLTYLFGGGERGFVFLTYHSARGLQLDAPVAWPVFLLDPAARVDHGYGSYNVTGALAARVAGLARWLMLLSVPLTVGLAARGFWRASRGQGRNEPDTNGGGGCPARGSGSASVATPPPAPPPEGEGCLRWATSWLAAEAKTGARQRPS
ncbi:MAG TPA: hypothetical protein VH092_21540, partial [Urbifossiella sp.]|nr:hypothetical protein [Urbifossiella sp.]